MPEWDDDTGASDFPLGFVFKSHRKAGTEVTKKTNAISSKELLEVEVRIVSFLLCLAMFTHQDYSFIFPRIINRGTMRE